MTGQLGINFSREVTNNAIRRAEESANRLHPNWSERAYDYLKVFVASRKPGERFLAEDIRRDAETCVPTPQSYRSWGAVLRRAIIDGVIIKVGIEKVSNPRAHRANASVYIKNL